MGDKITITTEKDGRIIVFEGSGTLMFTERVDDWVDTRPTSVPREGRGVEIKWDGGYYTIREADRQPDTLEDLAAAWEAAEEADECRKGDVLIEHFGPDAYHVYLAEGNYLNLPHAIRILSRAPREPWQDLADVLADMGNMSPTWYAKELYERGVRMAGGDDDA